LILKKNEVTMKTLFLHFLLALLLLSGDVQGQTQIPKPVIDGDWWQIAGNPDLGDISTPEQQPVDFGIWQAKDGTWQLWSCIRKTKGGAKTRLLFGWEGGDITDSHWQEQGIAMDIDEPADLAELVSQFADRVGQHTCAFLGSSKIEARLRVVFDSSIGADQQDTVSNAVHSSGANRKGTISSE